jgi:hypothetical protein
MRNFLSKFTEMMGLSVAVTCIGWVLVHLISFVFYGFILVGESNLLILLFEISITILGLFCFVTTYFLRK